MRCWDRFPSASKTRTKREADEHHRGAAAMIPANLFADIPTGLPAELVQTLVDGADVRIERIVSHGHSSPDGSWYDQETDEWVLVLQGAARLQFECQQPIELRPGDTVDIPAHVRHRVDWTTPAEPTVWLAVHYRPAAAPRNSIAGGA
jgi:cupin 2 domain-containing protein